LEIGQQRECSAPTVGFLDHLDEVDALSVCAGGDQSRDHRIIQVILGSKYNRVPERSPPLVARPAFAPRRPCGHVSKNQTLAFIGMPANLAYFSEREAVLPKPLDALWLDVYRSDSD